MEKCGVKIVRNKDLKKVCAYSIKQGEYQEYLGSAYYDCNSNIMAEFKLVNHILFPEFIKELKKEIKVKEVVPY